jgi:DNA-binding NarL/FixJ family response regulator
MQLTKRQRELLAHLATGTSNKTIARAMGVGEGTIKMMLHLLYGRLGVRNRTEAALLYVRKNHENQAAPGRAQAD